MEVDRPGDEFLSRAALPEDEHGGIGIRDALHHLERAMQCLAPAYDRLEPARRRDLLGDIRSAPRSPVSLGCLGDQELQGGKALVQGLFDVPERTRPQRFDRALGSARGCHRDAGCRRVEFDNPPDQLESVDALQLEIRQNDVYSAGGCNLEGLGSPRSE